MGAKRPCFKNLSVRGCKLFLLPTLCLVRISGFWLKVNFTGWIFIHFPRILSPQTSGNRTLLFRVIFLIQSQEQGCLGPPNCRMAEGGATLWSLPSSGQHFPGGSDGKVSAYNVGDPGSIPGSGRSSGKGNGKPLQCSCLENPVDGGAWWATVHGVAESDTTEQVNFPAVGQETQAQLQRCVFSWQARGPGK